MDVMGEKSIFILHQDYTNTLLSSLSQNVCYYIIYISVLNIFNLACPTETRNKTKRGHYDELQIHCYREKSVNKERQPCSQGSKKNACFALCCWEEN